MPGPRPPGDNADSSSLSRPGEQTAARKNMTVFLAYPQLEVSNQLFLNKLLNYRKEMTHSFSPVLYRSYANNLSHYLQIEHAYVILRWDAIDLFKIHVMIVWKTLMIEQYSY